MAATSNYTLRPLFEIYKEKYCSAPCGVPDADNSIKLSELEDELHGGKPAGTDYLGDQKPCNQKQKDMAEDTTKDPSKTPKKKSIGRQMTGYVEKHWKCMLVGAVVMLIALKLLGK